MLSMNGILILEFILGVVLMSLIFTSFPNTDLIADSSSKPKQEPEPDRVGAPIKPGRVRTEISCLIYMIGRKRRKRLRSLLAHETNREPSARHQWASLNFSAG